MDPVGSFFVNTRDPEREKLSEPGPPSRVLRLFKRYAHSAGPGAEDWRVGGLVKGSIKV